MEGTLGRGQGRGKDTRGTEVHSMVGDTANDSVGGT